MERKREIEREQSLRLRCIHTDKLMDTYTKQDVT